MLYSDKISNDNFLEILETKIKLCSFINNENNLFKIFILICHTHYMKTIVILLSFHLKPLFFKFNYLINFETKNKILRIKINLLR
jgi:hypothetical protein